jgi:hypothetical protein
MLLTRPGIQRTVHCSLGRYGNWERRKVLPTSDDRTCEPITTIQSDAITTG